MVHLATKYGSTRFTTAIYQNLITNFAMDPTRPYSLYQDTQCNYQKHDNPIYIKSIALQHIDTHYQGFQLIYTVCSKEPTTSKTVAAIYDTSGPFQEVYRCKDNISVYSTEIIALIAALKHLSIDDIYQFHFARRMGTPFPKQ
jgi:hypothetical protein